MIYGYARVSTKTQARDGNSLEAQEKQLRERGAELIYKDSFTGTRTDRPELDKLLSIIKTGDTLMITKLDRMARTVVQGLELVKTLQQKGVAVHILNMGLLDNSPNGKLMLTVFLAFAQFERDMIVERTQEGKAIARENAEAQGEKFKEGRPRVYDDAQIQYAMRLLDEGESYTKVSKLTGMSKSTLIRARRKLKADAAAVES